MLFTIFFYFYFLPEVVKILNYLPISNSTFHLVSFMVFLLFFRFPEFSYDMFWCSFLCLYHYWDSPSFLNLFMCFLSHRNFRHYFLKLVFCFIISLYFGPPVSCIKGLLILNQAYWSLSMFLFTIFVLQRETSVIRANKLIFSDIAFFRP